MKKYFAFAAGFLAGIVLLAVLLPKFGAKPPPPPAPSQPAVKFAAAASWRGGIVGAAGITWQASRPAAGFGLYVYQLPGDQVAGPVLDAIAQFNCADLEQSAPPGPKTAIMVLPVKANVPKGAPVIDLALSHQLLLDSLAKPDFSQVYVVIASAPITPQSQPDPDRAAITQVIKLGYIAPPLVASWLARLRDEIAAGHVSSPADFDLKIRSVLTAVGSAGIFIGVQSAQAAPPPPGCQ